MASRMRQIQTDKTSSRVRVGVWGSLSIEVGQEEQAVTSRGHRFGLGRGRSESLFLGNP